MKNKKMLIYIPAKRNSTRLEKKNSLKIAGKKLYEYSLDFALQLKKHFREYRVLIIFHSSLRLAEKYSKENVVQFKRKKREEEKDITIARQFKKLLFDSGLNEEYLPEDIFVILQPTTPHREIDDFVRTMMLVEKVDYLVSVKRLKNPVYFRDKNSKSLFGKNTMLMETGSFFIGKFKVLSMLNSFSGSLLAYPFEESCFLQDIDNEHEFKMVKNLLERGGI